MRNVIILLFIWALTTTVAHGGVPSEPEAASAYSEFLQDDGANPWFIAASFEFGAFGVVHDEPFRPSPDGGVTVLFGRHLGNRASGPGFGGYLRVGWVGLLGTGMQVRWDLPIHESRAAGIFFAPTLRVGISLINPWFYAIDRHPLRGHNVFAPHARAGGEFVFDFRPFRLSLYTDIEVYHTKTDGVTPTISALAGVSLGANF